MAEAFFGQSDKQYQELQEQERAQEIATHVFAAQADLQRAAEDRDQHRGGSLFARACEAQAKKHFSEVVKLTYTDTYTLAYRLVSNEDDAADVVQEAYQRAWRGLPNFKGEAQFTTWMYRITANAAHTFMKRRKRNQHQALDDIGGDSERFTAISGGQEEAAENKLLSERLQVVLKALSPKLREVVVLRDIYDLPHDAIAKELGISETAAKVRLHRARQKLREALHPHPEQ